MTDSRYIEPPTIPVGMTVADYRKRRGDVSRMQRVIRLLAARSPFSHRELRKQLANGNPYAYAYIARRGLSYDRGAIVKRGER